ncbi:MAG: endonuclease domain-containing protein [Pseudomonadota bacterium]
MKHAALRLRSAQTGPEAVLWGMLRGRQLEGLKFRRQTPVAGTVVDFFCAELKLVIELDGGVHDLREAEDAIRDERLRLAGFKVLRFRNNAFTTNPAIILNAIRRHAGIAPPLERTEPAPSSEPLRGPPSPPRGEGQETQ